MDFSEFNMVCEVEGDQKADQMLSDDWTCLGIVGGTRVEEDGSHTAYFRYCMGIVNDEQEPPLWS